MRSKYYGYWDNGSSYNDDPYVDTNLNRLTRKMMKIARGNDCGSGARWVIYTNPDKDAEPISEGYVSW
jgi:hypothetical protein